ncbi:hypothetical protein H2199_001137 [Coniosporium tulheliwenetii]|uniref:Uncharacterized protein n=1 Tax=Coniosporium tulheliwenetii TaxID=3383036 RepID=A0ACC2ZL63_9PEZI|nr:hypothetical protein H2199_001137 [Cladosporium sp. JES 115]
MLGYCRWFAKQQLRWVPFLGWGLWAMGTPLVSKEWTKDRAKMDKVFRGADPPIPVPRNILYPRTRGFVTSVRELRSSSVRAVYDSTIAYSRNGHFMDPPEFWESIAFNMDKVSYKFYVHVDRVALKDLPEADEEFAKWLKERWMRRDEILERLRKKLEAGEVDIDLND